MVHPKIYIERQGIVVVGRHLILETTKYVVDRSDHVRIQTDPIAAFCRYFRHKHINHWINEAPVDLNRFDTKDRLHFLVLFNALSFSYWGTPKWTVPYQGKKYDGAWGMFCALAKALHSGYPLLDPGYLATIPKKDFEQAMKANVQIPLVAQRWRHAREVGTVLTNDFQGDFHAVIQEAGKDAMRLLALLVKHFPSFEDSSIYKGQRVFFYKRAQLLISDVYQALHKEGVGNLKNIQGLTACADYKLPQVLRRYGILSYSPDLAYKIDAQIPLRKGSQEEVEIRANTIWAVELMKKALKKRLPGVDSIHVNDHLWLLSQQKGFYHLTRTTAY